MVVAPENQASQSPPHKSSLVRSILSNWVWYMLVLVSGFLLPRFIDRHQGQSLLGVWDLSWSMVSHISLLSLSVAAAVNRYVARYRSARDWQSLNEAFNSCLTLLGAGMVIGFAGALVCYVALPYVLVDADPQTLLSGQWVVLILASSAAVQILGGGFNGVITGCERFDVLNLIRGTRDFLILLGMLGLLLSGFGLVGLACVRLGGDLCGEVAKFWAAKRLCPQLRISPAFFRRSVAKEMLGFGGKAALQNIARAALYYTNSILVAFFLGAPVLAVFSRQRALVMHLMRFVKQYAQVFIPRSSSMDAQNDSEGLRRMTIEASKYGLYVTLPLSLAFIVLGGPLLNVWMGEEYEAPVVLALLAAGHLFVGSQLSTYTVLVGMGRHGKPALFELLAALVSIMLGVVLLGVFDGGMIAAALAVALPIFVTGGLLIPLYACRVLELSLWRYFRSVLAGPVAACVPYGVGLLLVRYFFADEPVTAVLLGAAVGGSVLGVIYWTWVLPESVKARITGRLFGRSTASPPKSA